MSGLGVVLVLVAVLVAGVVGHDAGAVAGALAGGVLAVVGLQLTRAARDRRLTEAAKMLSSWAAGEPGRRGVATPASGPWRALALAMNELGRALDESEAMLEVEAPWRRELVAACAGPALLFELGGHLADANDAAVELVGTPSPDTAPTAIAVTGNARLADVVQTARPGQGLQELEVALGDRRVRASVAVVSDMVLVTLDDLSERDRVDEVRRSFVVNASHELKTPATSIATLAEALELSLARSPERVPELVGRLREESARLIHMVHDLLSLRRVEDHDLRQVEVVDLARLTRDVVAELLDRADQREVEVALDAPDRLEARVDPDDLRLVVRNLVANAIQYNRPDGHVEITLHADPVRLVVSDTGIGIPQQDLERIFERFHRVDVARSRSTGGTGLGLAITRHAVERNGGTIAVESLVGEGSTFTVTLPPAPPPARS